MCKNRIINGICPLILCRHFLVNMNFDNRKETKFRPESSVVIDWVKMYGDGRRRLANVLRT